jgi:hypothetical protein
MSFSELILAEDFFEAFADAAKHGSQQLSEWQDEGGEIQTYTPSNISSIVLLALFIHS